MTEPAGFPLPVAKVATLGETVPGDVFYLAADPSRVYARSPQAPRDREDYSFIEMEDDVWRKLQDVGDGDPYQVVVVVHNATRGT